MLVSFFPSAPVQAWIFFTASKKAMGRNRWNTETDRSTRLSPFTQNDVCGKANAKPVSH